MTNGEQLQVITIEPVLTENPKKTLPFIISVPIYDDEDEDQIKPVVKDELYDTFTSINLVMLTYNVNSIDDNDSKYTSNS